MKNATIITDVERNLIRQRCDLKHQIRHSYRKNMHEYFGKYCYGLTMKKWLMDINHYVDNFAEIGGEYFTDLVYYLLAVVQEVKKFDDREYLRIVVFENDEALSHQCYGSNYKNKFMTVLKNKIS